MSNISGKLNLMQLKAAIRKMNGANGPIDCIVIPIEANHLFRGEQGVYLDLIAFESKTKNEKIKDTHLVKQSLPKEVLELMSDEERKSQPIIGNLRVWGEFTEQAPQSDMTVGDEKDDLPF
jgi:predicted ATP-grasp superfamily ATP-dependent carboligase